MPKITTKATANVIKQWKESYKIKSAYRKFNDSDFCSKFFRNCWSKRATKEQMAFTISVIKYIFNPKIYSIQIKDEFIRHYMKKTLKLMDENKKIQFLQEEFDEEEEREEEKEEEEEEEERREEIRDEIVAEGSAIE